jgi:hypothetical protein
LMLAHPDVLDVPALPADPQQALPTPDVHTPNGCTISQKRE